MNYRPRAVPGKYSVTMAQRVGGVVSPLGGPEQKILDFNVDFGAPSWSPAT